MLRQKFKEWSYQWCRRCQSKETSTQNEWINLHKNLYSLTWDLNLNTVGSPNMAAYYDWEHRNGPIRLDNTGRTGACTCRLQGQWFHLRFQSDYLHTTLRHFVSIPLAKSLAFRKILEQKQCKKLKFTTAHIPSSTCKWPFLSRAFAFSCLRQFNWISRNFRAPRRLRSSFHHLHPSCRIRSMTLSWCLGESPKTMPAHAADIAKCLLGKRALQCGAVSYSLDPAPWCKRKTTGTGHSVELIHLQVLQL